MNDRFFDCFVLPRDTDVVFVGLSQWNKMDGDPTPLLGPYLCDEAEVNQRFDALEADLKRCRRATLAKIGKVQRDNAMRIAKSSAARLGR